MQYASISPANDRKDGVQTCQQYTRAPALGSSRQVWRLLCIVVLSLWQLGHELNYTYTYIYISEYHLMGPFYKKIVTPHASYCADDGNVNNFVTG